MGKRLTPEQRTVRFWSRVDRSNGDSACWLWTASVIRHGYGRFWDGERLDLAVRWIYRQLHGSWLIDDLWVWKTCGNPRCVNPRHLYLDLPDSDELRRCREAHDVPTPKQMLASERRNRHWLASPENRALYPTPPTPGTSD